MNTIWNNASYRATINRASGDMPTFSVKFVATIGGTTYTIDSSMIKQKNFATDSVSGDGFTFGDFVGRSCDLTFFDMSAAYSSVALKGAYGTLSYGVVSGGVTTWISYGTFVVEDVKRDGGVVWMSLVDLRKRFGEVGFTPSSTGLTLFQLAQEVVTAANVVSGLPTVSLGNTSGDMPNGSLVLTNVGLSEIKSGNSSVSLSQMVCYIAQASGTFATIGSDDKLYFKWYATPTNACLIESEFVPDSIEISEYSVGVTGISWTDLEGNTTTNGTEGYMIQITDNPLTFANYATVLSGMASRVVGFSYTPLNFTYIGNPAIEVGDMITVVDDQNVSHLFPVTSTRYSNLLSQTISAAEGADSTDSGSTGLSITQQIKNSANNVIAYARIMELDADKITSGTIDADRIGANTITADKLMIGTGNLLNDIDSFEQHKAGDYGGYRSQASAFDVIRGYSYHGNQCMRLANTSANVECYGLLNPLGTGAGYIPLTEVGNYLLSAYVRVNYPMNVRLNAIIRSGATVTTSPTSTGFQVSMNTQSGQGYVRLTGIINVPTVADNPHLLIALRHLSTLASRNSLWDAIQLEYIGARTDLNASAFSVGGQTLINADNITTGTLIAQVLKNTLASDFYATVGEEVIGTNTYKGIFGYVESQSTTNPAFKLTGSTGNVSLSTGNLATFRMADVYSQTRVGTSPNTAEISIDALSNIAKIYIKDGMAGLNITATYAELMVNSVRAGIDSGGLYQTKSSIKTYVATTQSGSATVAQTGTTTIYFPTAFSSTPRVFLQQHDTATICPVRIVNTYADRFQVQRTDAYASSVKYNWFAVLQ